MAIGRDAIGVGMKRRRTAERRAGRKKRARQPSMPGACARRFVRIAAKLDAHTWRLDLLETLVVAVAVKDGLPF